jgi:hypothetical protein
MRLTGLIEGFKVLGHLHHHLLTLAFGDVASGGLIETIEGVIEAHHRHILSQTLAQAIGVFVGGKIQLGIEGKAALDPAGAIRASTHDDLTKERVEMTLGALTAMRADNVIIAFETFPVGFGVGAIIELPLEQASEQFTALRVEKLLDLTMVELLGLRAVQ